MKTIFQRSLYVFCSALLIFAIVFACSPAVRAGVSSYFNFDSSGNLKVNCATGCGAGGGGGSPLTGGSQGVATAASQSTAVHGFNGSTLDALLEGAAEPATWLTANVTGNASAQSVAVSESTTIPVGSYVTAYGDNTGTPLLSNAEIVQVTAKADSSHITGIFKNSHAAGALIEPVGVLSVHGEMSLAGDTLGNGSSNSYGILAMPSASVLYARDAGSVGTLDKIFSGDAKALEVTPCWGGACAAAIQAYGNLSGDLSRNQNALPVGAFDLLYDHTTDRTYTQRTHDGQGQVTTGGDSLLKATATACTSIVTGQSVLNKVWSAAASETATLSIYNEGASPTCAAADLIWSGIPSNAAPLPDFGIPMSLGIAYKLSATAVNNDYLTYGN